MMLGEREGESSTEQLIIIHVASKQPTCMIMSHTVVLPLAVPPATPMKKGWACMRFTPPIDLFLTEPALRIELSSSSKGSVLLSERSPVRGTGIGVDGEEIETLRALAW